MSFPHVPNITPNIKITKEEAVNLLLASIAFEELGLAHVINAEAEKIQYILGTLAGQSTSVPSTIEEIVSINKSVRSILRTVIKHQMLLQFKLEDVMSISTNSTTTVTTTTTTTTQTATTSTTTCDPVAAFAVIANNNFDIASQSTINANTQVNGNMNISRNGNDFKGNTNVVGALNESECASTFDNLVLNASPVPIRTFNDAFLQSDVDLFINGDVDITSAKDALQFQGKTVWVNGTVSISGDDISITGGGILATGTITVSGGYFTYTSTKCFAFYSQTGDVRIYNGPYNITGLIYTAPSAGDIRLSTSQGGSVFGALMSGRDVIFRGRKCHQITNTGECLTLPEL